MASTEQNSLSKDTKTIITAILLVFFFPVGFILMWIWTSWPKWVKWLITTPIIIGILGIIATALLVIINPVRQIQRAQKAQCIKECIDSVQNTVCINVCMQKFTTPTLNK